MLATIYFAQIFFTHLQEKNSDIEEDLDRGEMHPVQKQVSKLSLLHSQDLSLSTAFLFMSFSFLNQWKFTEGIAKLNPFRGANRVRKICFCLFIYF